MSNTPGWLRKAAHDRAEGMCEAMLPTARPRCQWHGTDVHHRKKRSAGGEHTLENALWVCRPCHMALEGDPATSFGRGLLVHAWGEPTWPPDFYRGVMTRKEGT